MVSAYLSVHSGVGVAGNRLVYALEMEEKLMADFTVQICAVLILDVEVEAGTINLRKTGQCIPCEKMRNKRGV